MLAVGKSQVTAWKDLLETKGLSAAAPALEDYGLSCENDMLRLDEDDLVALCSKLKVFLSKLLRKWVQGLVYEQRAAAFMKDDSAAKKAKPSTLSKLSGTVQAVKSQLGLSGLRKTCRCIYNIIT